MTRSCRLYPLSLTRDNLEIIPSHIHGHPTFDASACILLFPHHDPRIICLLCNQQFPRRRLSTRYVLLAYAHRHASTRHLVLYLYRFVGDPQSPFATLLPPEVHLLCCYRSLRTPVSLPSISAQRSCCPLRSSFVVLFIHFLVDTTQFSRYLTTST